MCLTNFRVLAGVVPLVLSTLGRPEARCAEFWTSLNQTRAVTVLRLNLFRTCKDRSET